MLQVPKGIKEGLLNHWLECYISGQFNTVNGWIKDRVEDYEPENSSSIGPKIVQAFVKEVGEDRMIELGNAIKNIKRAIVEVVIQK